MNIDQGVLALCDYCIDCSHCFSVHGILWWPSYSHRGPFDLTEYVEAARCHQPIVSSKSLFKFLIMHSSTVALDSFPHILLTFSDLLLFFHFVLSMKFSVPYALLIFSLKEIHCHSASFLIGMRRALTCQIPEGEGRLACLHLPVGMAQPEHHVLQDCFSLNF